MKSSRQPFEIRVNWYISLILSIKINRELWLPLKHYRDKIEYVLSSLKFAPGVDRRVIVLRNTDENTKFIYESLIIDGKVKVTICPFDINYNDIWIIKIKINR